MNGNTKWIMGIVGALFLLLAGAYMNDLRATVNILLDSRMDQDGAIHVMQTQINYIETGVREIKDAVKELKARP